MGAIKLRVQEHGGIVKPLDASARAKQVKEEAAYLQDRNYLLGDGVFIQGVHQVVRATLAQVGDLVNKLNTEHGMQVEFGAHDRMGVLRSGFVSVRIGWTQPISNMVGGSGKDECHLRVSEFSGLLALPGEHVFYFEDPRLLKETKFKVDVAHDRTLLWRPVGKAVPVAPAQLADRIVQIFLDLVSRANKGEVEPPHI